MSYLITPRGEKQEARPKDGHSFTITELQDMVDGYIDMKEAGENIVVFDVDGMTKNKLYNKTATELVQEFNQEWTDFVAGNAVVCRRVRVD